MHVLTYICPYAYSCKYSSRRRKHVRKLFLTVVMGIFALSDDIGQTLLRDFKSTRFGIKEEEEEKFYDSFNKLFDYAIVTYLVPLSLSHTE